MTSLLFLIDCAINQRDYMQRQRRKAEVLRLSALSSQNQNHMPAIPLLSEIHLCGISINAHHLFGNSPSSESTTQSFESYVKTNSPAIGMRTLWAHLTLPCGFFQLILLLCLKT